MSTILMYDAVPDGVQFIPSDAKAVAGYVDGHYVSFPLMVHRFFPRAHCVSIGIYIDSLAEFIDVEPGNPVITQAQVRASFLHRRANGVWRPGFYADRSHMETVVIPALAGIPREEYRLWVAQWDDNPRVPSGYDAHQFTNNQRAGGGDGPYDTSAVDTVRFFPKPRGIIHRIKRPTRPAKPHRKVVASTGGAAVGSAAIVGILHAVGITVTSVEAGEIAAVLAFLAGYAIPARP